MQRKRHSHPNKHIEAAIKYAEHQGWRVVPSGASGHAWGKICCPHNNPECRCGEFCVISIASTPRSAENHAKMVRRRVSGCIGATKDDGGGWRE